MPSQKIEDCTRLIPVNGQSPKLYIEESDQKHQYQLEDIIQSTGGCGRYQIQLTIITHLMRLPSLWGVYVLIFANATPRWTCADDIIGDSNITWSENCTNKNGSICSKFLFDTSLMNTFVSEWSLVCDRDWIPYTISSIHLGGMAFGGLLAGMLSDSIGRKKPLYISVLILGIGNGIAFVSPSWGVMAVVRLFLGIGAAFTFSVIFVIVSEVTLSKWRARIHLVPSWPALECMFSVLTWLVPDWAYLHLTTMLCTIPFFITWTIVMESIRWLMVHDKSEEADGVIHKIASINKHPYPGSDMVKAVTDSLKQEHRTSKDKTSVLDMFKGKYMMKISVGLLINWFSMAFSMYGIQFDISSLSGNLFLNMFLFSLLSMPMCSLCACLSDTIGRKTTVVLITSTICLSSLGAGIARLSDIKEAKVLHTGLALLAFIAANGGFIPKQLLSVELYPTAIRTRAYSCFQMSYPIAAILAPQLSYFGNKTPGLLYFIISGMSLFATITSLLLLPETKDAPMQEHVIQEEQPESSQSNNS